jgi:hypothetical protein
MGVPRQRPAHRIRRWASGLTRPTKGTTEPVQQRDLLPPAQGPQPLSELARFLAGFDPYEDEEAPQLPVPDIRLRSAPWDIMSGDASSVTDEDYDSASDSQHSHDEEESIHISVWMNLLARRRPRPTHYVPLADLPDPWVRDLVQHGASLPPPLHAPRCFQRTPPSPLMDEAIHHLQQGILVPQRVTAAYRCFLVPKADRSARFVIDLSPLTSFYNVPRITLYGAARVLATIYPTDQMIKLDLSSGFFQIPI